MNRGLSAADVLYVWEWGRARHAVDRALLILAAAHPGMPHEALETLSVGARDRRLLRLRAAMMGDAIGAAASCTHCGTELEFSFRVQAVLGDGADASAAVPQPMEGEAEGIRFRVRHPDSRDLAAIAEASDDEEARLLLLRRCLLDAADAEGRTVAAEDMPRPVSAMMAAKLAGDDPAADILFDVHCDSCGNVSTIVFDIAGFLWAEIDALAHRLLDEVGTLARAFGWRESDILALSPARRQAYLAMAA